MVDAGNVDQSDFDAAQSKFVDIVNKGITQRKKNQDLADGNAASDGLATVSYSFPLFFPCFVVRFELVVRIRADET